MNNELLVSLLSGDNTQEISSKSDERKKIIENMKMQLKCFWKMGLIRIRSEKWLLQLPNIVMIM